MRCPIVECLTLLQVIEEESDGGLVVLEHLYAMQYMAPGPVGPEPPSQPQAVFTHALHLRFQSLQAAQAFLDHREVGRVRAAEAPRIAGAATLLFEARVAPGMYLRQLADVAQSSLAGAVQATHGRLRSATGGPWTHALLTRFSDRAQLRAFLALPPCRALLGGRDAAAAAGAPLHAALSASFDIGPMQGAATRTSGSEPGLL
ncbi:hypothetical protein WJX81_002680 [Elliptochloris bilobata]|uniref:Uncharacterized protein n=1 Tax=Elliptochloris bilobata TaxID=381761 RepID=A0AAW1SBW8_9CHLO